MRRGFPEIDPLWLAMRWLWPIPLIISGVIYRGNPARKCCIIVYTVVVSVLFSGTVIDVVPHYASLNEMLLGALFWAPLNTVTAFGIEKLSRRIFPILGVYKTRQGEEMSRPVPAVAAIFALLVFSIAFPFACRAGVFYAAWRSGCADAEQAWADGNAIYFVDPEGVVGFGVEEGCFDVRTGLRVERVRPGVTTAIYCAAYRSVVERKLAQAGPVKKADLCTENDLSSWIKSGRFRKVRTFPLKQGHVEITPTGYRVNGAAHNAGLFRGEASKFLYYATVPEKENDLVVITDDDVLVFANSGDLLQSVDYETYRRMNITESTLLAQH
jgi:hypothetical protein